MATSSLVFKFSPNTVLAMHIISTSICHIIGIKLREISTNTSNNFLQCVDIIKKYPNNWKIIEDALVSKIKKYMD